MTQWETARDIEGLAKKLNWRKNRFTRWINDWYWTIRLMLIPRFNESMEQMCREIRESGFEPFRFYGEEDDNDIENKTREGIHLRD